MSLSSYCLRIFFELALDDENRTVLRPGGITKRYIKETDPAGPKECKTTYQ